MGLFDFFKKRQPEPEKKTTVNVTISPVQTRSDTYKKDEQIALFLHYMDTSKALPLTSDDRYGYHIRFHCGDLISPSRLHRQLISEGYFVAEPIESKLSRLKVQELRDLAALHNVDSKGLKKAELVVALGGIVSPDEIKTPNSEECYLLSDKAKAYLKQYEVLLYLADHREFGISIREFENAAIGHRGSFRDVIWKILNAEMNHLLAGRNYGAVCHVFECMASFLLEEAHYKDALRFYLLKLYFNVNYPSIQQLMSVQHVTTQQDKKLMLDMFDVNDFDTFVAKKIISLSEHYDDTIADKVFTMRLLPYEFLSQETFIAMIHDMMSNPLFNSAEYMEKGRKAAEHRIRML